jgi:hypothetical protein
MAQSVAVVSGAAAVGAFLQEGKRKRKGRTAGKSIWAILKGKYFIGLSIVFVCMFKN